jgi:hypothetical protein
MMIFSVGTSAKHGQSPTTRWFNKCLLFLLTIILVLQFTGIASACVSPPPQPDIWIVIHNDGSLWIIIHKFSTFAAQPGGFCACALNFLPANGRVVGARIAEGSEVLGEGKVKLGTPLKEFPFKSNASTAVGFQALQPAEAWQGFLAEITEEIPEGRVVDLQFEIDPAVPTDDVVAALEAADPLVATDEAGDDGAPLNSHLSIETAGTVMIALEVSVEPKGKLTAVWAELKTKR